MAKLQNELRNKENQWQSQLKNKDNQINLLSKNSQDNTNKLKEKENIILLLSSDKSKLDADNKQLKNNYEKVVGEIKKLQSDKAKVETEFNTKLTDVTKNLTQMQKEKNAAYLTASTEINKLNSSIATLEKEYKKLKADFEVAITNYNELQDSKAKFEKDANSSLTAAQKSLEQLQKEKMETESAANAKIAELKSISEMTKSEIDNKNNEIANLKMKITEAEQSMKNLEETTQMEKNSITTRFEEEKRILDEKISQTTQLLNERNAAINKLALEQEQQDTSMNSVELSNMMTIDLLKTKISELQIKLEQLIALSKQKLTEKKKLEIAITQKMHNEKQTFLAILYKNQELERNHLKAIDEMKTLLRKTLEDQKRIAAASKIMAEQYRSKLKKAAQVIQNIKAEYAKNLIATRKAELSDFLIIDSLKTKLAETVEMNKKLIKGITKLVVAAKNRPPLAQEETSPNPQSDEQTEEISAIHPDSFVSDDQETEEAAEEEIEVAFQDEDDEQIEEIEPVSQDWEVFSIAEIMNNPINDLGRYHHASNYTPPLMQYFPPRHPATNENYPRVISTPDYHVKDPQTAWEIRTERIPGITLNHSRERQHPKLHNNVHRWPGIARLPNPDTWQTQQITVIQPADRSHLIPHGKITMGSPAVKMSNTPNLLLVSPQIQHKKKTSKPAQLTITKPRPLIKPAQWKSPTSIANPKTLMQKQHPPIQKPKPKLTLNRKRPNPQSQLTITKPRPLIKPAQWKSPVSIANPKTLMQKQHPPIQKPKPKLTLNRKK
ncbi:MAG: hypothetical protein LBL32_00850, partial [Holosporales bacterium]|nr:hypothetical protein [Holosporales bacterium]